MSWRIRGKRSGGKVKEEVEANEGGWEKRDEEQSIARLGLDEATRTASKLPLGLPMGYKAMVRRLLRRSRSISPFGISRLQLYHDEIALR